MEKDGIILKFSVRHGKLSSLDNIIERNSSYLRLKNDGLLTVEGNSSVITSIVFIVSDFRHILKVDNGVGKLKGSRIGSKEYKQVWNGESDRISFLSVNSGDVNIKLIEVFYEKIQPKGISIAVSSAERALKFLKSKKIMVISLLLFLRVSLHVLIRLKVMFSLKVRSIKKELFSPKVQPLF